MNVFSTTKMNDGIFEKNCSKIYFGVVGFFAKKSHKLDGWICKAEKNFYSCWRFFLYFVLFTFFWKQNSKNGRKMMKEIIVRW